MLIVSNSASGSPSGSAAVPAIGSSGGSVIPARELVLVEREQDGLAAHREVAPLRVALVVLGHKDAAQVGMALEDHPEHVEHLALLVVGGGEEVDRRRQRRVLDADARLDAEAGHAPPREELV